MNKNDVVITGVGMVTPLGVTCRASVRAWQAGEQARAGRLDALKGTPAEGVLAAVNPPLDPAKRLGNRRHVKFMSRAAAMGCVAAREAADAAGIKQRYSPGRIGLYTGIGLAAVGLDEIRGLAEKSIDDRGAFSCRLLGGRALRETNPIMSFRILANIPSCLVSMLENVRGPNYIFTPWEGQTGMAFVEAWKALSSGAVDCALVGAASDAAHPLSVLHLKQASCLAGDEYPASGAAYLVMERRERAERDGVQVLACFREASVKACAEPVFDPLSRRMGRSFAASPAILMGLSCFDPKGTVSVCGVDRQLFRAEIVEP